LTYANDVFDVCYRTTREPCDARLDDASDYQLSQVNLSLRHVDDVVSVASEQTLLWQ